jgi:hypothetical protein
MRFVIRKNDKPMGKAIDPIRNCKQILINGASNLYRKKEFQNKVSFFKHLFTKHY